MTQQWDVKTHVWAVIRPEYGIKLYGSKREATRASYGDCIVSELPVWRELTKDYEPMFTEES